MRRILLHVFVLTVFVCSQIGGMIAFERMGYWGTVEMNDRDASCIDEDCPEIKQFNAEETEFLLLRRSFSAGPNKRISGSSDERLPAWSMLSIFSPPPNWS